MSVKNLLVLTAAGLAAIGATAVMAGGPDHMAMPSEPAFQNSIYLEGHFGYAQSNWTKNNSNKLIGASATSAYDVSSHGKGYLTAGADLGYNITQHIAVEAGWFYLPKVAGSVTTLGTGTDLLPAGSGAVVRSWFAYTAAKLSVPVMDNLDLFGKVGVAYRALNYSVPSTVRTTLGVSDKGHYWTPVFGTGIQYTWGNWLLGAQYMYLPANTEINYGAVGGLLNAGAPNAAPAVNLYTGSLGYKFNV